MTNDHRQDDSKHPHYEGPAPILKGPLTEREARENRAAEHDEQYKNRQLLFNLLLVIVGALTLGVYAYQAYVMNVSLKAAKKSADAAEKAATVGKETLDFMRESGVETIRQNREALEATLKQNRDSLDASIRQFETAQRPRMKISEPRLTAPVRFDNGDLTFKVVFELSNVGLSTATGVTLNVGAMVREISGKRSAVLEPVDAQKKLCGSVARESPAPYGLAIFPNQVIPSEQSARVARSEVDARAFKFGSPPGPAVIPVIFGCADYIGLSSRHHQTGFIYEVYRRRDVSGMGPAFEVGGNIPGFQEVGFRQYELGGFYAN